MSRLLHPELQQLSVVSSWSPGKPSATLIICRQKAMVLAQKFRMPSMQLRSLLQPAVFATRAMQPATWQLHHLPEQVNWSFAPRNVSGELHDSNMWRFTSLPIAMKNQLPWQLLHLNAWLSSSMAFGLSNHQYLGVKPDLIQGSLPRCLAAFPARVQPPSHAYEMSECHYIVSPDVGDLDPSVSLFACVPILAFGLDVDKFPSKIVFMLVGPQAASCHCDSHKTESVADEWHTDVSHANPPWPAIGPLSTKYSQSKSTALALPWYLRKVFIQPNCGVADGWQRFWMSFS